MVGTNSRRNCSRKCARYVFKLNINWSCEIEAALCAAVTLGARLQVAASVKPTLVIFVMDGSIGQAAFDQAKAFKDSVEVTA